MAQRWLGRRATIVLALVIVVLGGVAFGLFVVIENAQTRLLSGIHDSCVGSATEAARTRGVDVAKPDLTQKIERYCSCVADAVKSGNVTTAELSAFSANPQAVDPTTAKVRDVVAICLR